MTTPADPKQLVWDAPVRVFHWLMVACFAGAWLTAESERWRLVHVTLGYSMAGMVAWRVVWGFVGSRHARFASFVRGPAAAWRYVTSMLWGTPEHHAGHNPAGGLAIVALLLLVGATATAGVLAYNDIGGDWVGELHEGAANTLMAVVLVHLAGVVAGSITHRENLVRAMFTGRKRAAPGEGIARPWRGVAALLLAAVLGFWLLQWSMAPPPADTQNAAGSGHHKRDRDHH